MLNRFFKGKKQDGSGPHDDQNRRAEIQQWMQEKIAEQLKVAPESLDPNKPFTSYGLDSIAGIMLVCDLADWLGRELPASLLWEFTTIAELAEHLAEERNP